MIPGVVWNESDDRNRLKTFRQCCKSNALLEFFSLSIAMALPAKLTVAPAEVTPDAVKSLGMLMGLSADDKNYLYLLIVPKLLLTLPLPVGWKHCLDDVGHSVYLDKRCAVQHTLRSKILASRADGVFNTSVGRR